MTQQRSLFHEAREPSFPSRPVEGPVAFVPLAELMPGAAGGPAAGIARMAATAPEIDQRNDVEYLELECRTLISPVASRRVPFDYGINPYRGCEFGCRYCYARYTHEYMELEQWLEFERKVFVKRGAGDALLRDLRRLDLSHKFIAIGTATDPYQPAERRYGLTRSLLEIFARRRNLRLSITTKSDLVTRDLDLLKQIAAHNELHVNVTVTTPHHELSRRTEPRAPRPDKRLAAVRMLADAGVRTGVFVMPILPRITDGLEDLELLLGLARQAGAGYVAAGVLFLRKCSKRAWFPFLEREFPELLPFYRRLYASNHTEALKNYQAEITAQLRELRWKHGFYGERRSPEEAAFRPDQLALLEQE